MSLPESPRWLVDMDRETEASTGNLGGGFWGFGFWGLGSFRVLGFRVKGYGSFRK